MWNSMIEKNGNLQNLLKALSLATVEGCICSIWLILGTVQGRIGIG